MARWLPATGCFPLRGDSEEGAFCSHLRGPGVLQASPRSMEDVGPRKEVCSVWDTNAIVAVTVHGGGRPRSRGAPGRRRRRSEWVDRCPAQPRHPLAPSETPSGLTGWAVAGVGGGQAAQAGPVCNRRGRPPVIAAALPDLYGRRMLADAELGPGPVGVGGGPEARSLPQLRIPGQLLPWVRMDDQSPRGLFPGPALWAQGLGGISGWGLSFPSPPCLHTLAPSRASESLTQWDSVESLTQNPGQDLLLCGPHLNGQA